MCRLTCRPTVRKTPNRDPDDLCKDKNGSTNMDFRMDRPILRNAAHASKSLSMRLPTVSLYLKCKDICRNIIKSVFSTNKIQALVQKLIYMTGEVVSTLRTSLRYPWRRAYKPSHMLPLKRAVHYKRSYFSSENSVGSSIWEKNSLKRAHCGAIEELSDQQWNGGVSRRVTNQIRVVDRTFATEYKNVDLEPHLYSLF
jgi:hypothetical protein